MAATVVMKWFGDRIERGLRSEVESRLEAVGEFVADQVRGNISTPGPPASAPGEYPHQVTGELAAGVKSVLNRRELTVRVVATAPHSPHVEQRRPFLRRTLFESRSMMRQIMLGSGVSRGRFKFK